MQKSFIRFFFAGGIILGSAWPTVAVNEADEARPHEASASNHSNTEVYNAEINYQQRKSMFLHGTIPISSRNGKFLGTLEVNYLPGAENIMKDSKKILTEALESLKPYVQTKEFWQNEIWHSCRSILKESWKISCQDGVGKLSNDYHHFREKFDSVSLAQFGGLGTKCLASAKFGTKCITRPMVSAISLSAGAALSIAVPVLKLLWPLTRSMVIGTYGVVKPSVKMVWHAGAWTMTQIYTQTPSLQDSATITWVPARAAR